MLPLPHRVCAFHGKPSARTVLTRKPTTSMYVGAARGQQPRAVSLEHGLTPRGLSGGGAGAQAAWDPCSLCREGPSLIRTGSLQPPALPVSRESSAGPRAVASISWEACGDVAGAAPL